MGAIAAIGLNTFREAVRDRILYSMLFFAVGLILLSLVLGKIAPQEQLRLTIDVGLAAISLMTILLAIVLGGANLHKEIERKTVYFILPMPIARWQFLVGKLVGLLWVLLVTLAVMGGSLLTVMAWHAERLRPMVAGLALFDVAIVVILYVSLRRHPALWPSLLALWILMSGGLIALQAGGHVALVSQGLCLILAEGIVITSIALLFSSFSTPFLSGVMTFLVFVAGRQLPWLDTLSQRVESPLGAGLLKIIGVSFPNCYLFVPSVNILEGRLVVTGHPGAPWELVANAASYGLIYSAMVLGLACLVLWRRDFV